MITPRSPSAVAVEMVRLFDGKLRGTIDQCLRILQDYLMAAGTLTVLPIVLILFAAMHGAIEGVATSGSRVNQFRIAAGSA